MAAVRRKFVSRDKSHDRIDMTRTRPVVRAGGPRAETPAREGAPAPAAPAAAESSSERIPVAPFQITYVRPVGSRPLNMLIYGPFGHGKTTFGGSALDVASMRDVLMIDADSGDMSLTSRRDLDIIKINKWDTLGRILEFLVKHCYLRDQGKFDELLELEKFYKSDLVPISDQTAPVDPNRTWFEEQRIRTGKPMDEPYVYRTTLIDTLSECYKYLIYKYTGVIIGKTKITEDVERMEEWQSAQELFRLFIRSFRDLAMNVIFICAENIEPEMKNNKRNKRAGQALPALAGQMATGVATFLDIVGYLVREDLEGGEKHRYLYLGAGYEGWISKHRFENLPDLEYVEDPTLSSIIDLARKDAEAHGTSSAPRAVEAQSEPTRRTTRSVSPQRGSAAAGSGSSNGRGRSGRGDTVRRQR